MMLLVRYAFTVTIEHGLGSAVATAAPAPTPLEATVVLARQGNDRHGRLIRSLQASSIAVSAAQDGLTTICPIIEFNGPKVTVTN